MLIVKVGSHRYFITYQPKEILAKLVFIRGIW